MSDWINATFATLTPRWPIGTGTGGSVLFLCTGNATRSVLAGAALAELRPDLRVDTAGTLSIDGLPMSWRTRAAFEDVGLQRPHHTSKQATADHLEAADLIVAMAPEHVAWVRREHGGFIDRTATLIHLVRSLTVDETSEASATSDARGVEVRGSSDRLASRVAGLRLSSHELSADEEVVDPGGGEVEAFIDCAREIVGLIERLAPVL